MHITIRHDFEDDVYARLVNEGSLLNHYLEEVLAQDCQATLNVRTGALSQ
jgi:hypothetical protein